MNSRVCYTACFTTVRSLVTRENTSKERRHYTISHEGYGNHCQIHAQEAESSNPHLKHNSSAI